MTLYGELFDKEGETIWDELLYMLTHPELEEEKLRKERQEKAYIDYVLEKGFSDTDETAEPYMSFEDFVRGKGVNQGVKQGVKQGVNQGDKLSVNNSLAPLNISNPQNPYDRINSDPNLSEEEKLSKILEVSRIQEEADRREKEINRQHAIEMAKDIGGAALEIGSAAVPGIGGAKVAGQAIKTAKPLIQQVVSKNLKRGLAEGTVSGAVEGFGRGLTEDKNPFKTAIIDSVIGGLSGLSLGKLSGEILARMPKIKNLDELLDKRNDWGIAYTKQSGKPEEAIEKLLEQKKGFVPKAISKEGVGDIDFVWGKQNYEIGQGYGLEHIIDGRVRKNKIAGETFVKQIPNTIKKGVLTQDELHPSNIYVEDVNNKVVIPNNWQGKPRNWLLTAFPQNKSASKRLAADAPMSKPNVDSRYTNFTTELTADNNIIPQKSQPFNNSTNQSSSIQPVPPPEPREDWLERLKRERRRRGWF